MYCGDKDRDLSDTAKVVTHLPWFTCVTKLAMYNHCFFSLYATRVITLWLKQPIVFCSHIILVFSTMRRLPWLQTNWSDVFMRVTVVWTVNLFLRPSSHVICQNIWIIYTWHEQYIYILPVTAMYICVYMQTYLDISLQHLSCGLLSSWQRSFVNIQWGYPHCRCSPHYSDRSDQYQYQSEHKWRQLHLLACNMWTQTVNDFI